MAEAKEQSKVKRSDLYDKNTEKNKLTEWLDIALNDCDDSWTKIDDNECKIHWKTIKPKGYDYDCLLIRSELIFKDNDASILNYFDYQKCGYKINNSNWIKDKGISEEKLIQTIDDDRDIAYTSHYSPASLVISAREWLYMKLRLKFNYYKSSNTGKEYKQNMGGVFYYSITDKNHPYWVKPKPKHVRGSIIYNGYLLIEQNKGEIRMIKSTCADPAGSIPTWILKTQVANQARGVVDTKKAWPKIMEIVNNRRDKQLKQDCDILFEDSDFDHLPIKTVDNNADAVAADADAPNDDLKNNGDDNAGNNANDNANADDG